MENEEESEIDKSEEEIDEDTEKGDSEEETDKEDEEEESKETDASKKLDSLGEEKDLVEHVAESIEHMTSETAKELDESKEIENTKKVEAALFIAGRFLTLQELVMLTDINPLMLKELLEKLIEKYNDNSGIEIIEKGGGWKMDVCKEHVHMINKLATGNSEFTKAEQETLAVIAYKQPVKQSVIVNIRGNKAYDHIKKFIENELVVGKKVGHTKELRLSDDFYEYFHIRDKKLERVEDINNKDTNEKPVISQEQSGDDDNSKQNADEERAFESTEDIEDRKNKKEEEDSGEEEESKENKIEEE